MPKIISEHCELVKLHHINRSGPGFSDTLYSTTLFVLEQELSYCSLPRMADRTRAVKTTLFTSALRRIFSNR